MYISSSLLDLGLNEGQQWPSETHQKVAATIALGNPNVKDRGTLTAVVQAILTVPEQEIKFIYYAQLVKEYKMPDVGMYR